LKERKRKKNANLRSGPKTKRASEELDDILLVALFQVL